MKGAMSEKGKYVYGIINSNIDNILGSYRRVVNEPGLSLFSDNIDPNLRANGKVYFIPYKDISAAVGNSEIVNYMGMPKDTLARFLVKHQRVIEKIMSLGYTIIPMRLGTFLKDEDEVKDILERGYSLMKDIIHKISDKIEIDIVSTWSDFASVLKELGEEKEIKEYKQKLLANPKEISVDDQMKVGAMVKKALDNKREQYSFKIQSILKNVSQALKTHELMDDKMIINTAFLINKTIQKEFDTKIEDLNHKFNDKLNFRCVGPLPPYSFYTLEIKRILFNDIDWARKKLSILNDVTTKNEIKKAYKRLTFSYHPDKNPEAIGIEKEFDEINKAYRVLVDYWEACNQADEIEKVSFIEEEFKKCAILLKVREQDG